jgi:hypothetical protein
VAGPSLHQRFLLIGAVCDHVQSVEFVGMVADCVTAVPAAVGVILDEI